MQVSVVNPTRKGRKRSSTKKKGGRKKHRTAKQKAASKKNIKKAQAARRRKANPKKRRRKAKTTKRKRSYTKPRKRSYKRNPIRMASAKKMLPNLKGYKWGLKDVLPGIGGFVTTSLVSGAAKTASGSPWGGPVGGGIYIVATAAVFKKVKMTSAYATAWFAGGLIAWIVDIVVLLTRSALTQPMAGLSSDELGAMDPIDQAKALVSKGIGDVQELLGGLTKGSKMDADYYSKELAKVDEPGWEGQDTSIDSTLHKVEALGDWLGRGSGLFAEELI